MIWWILDNSLFVKCQKRYTSIYVWSEVVQDKRVCKPLRDSCTTYVTFIRVAKVALREASMEVRTNFSLHELLELI